MNTDQWQQVKTLLEECLDRPTAERVPWLDGRCDDPELRAEVLSLLDSYADEGDGFLDTPPRAGADLVNVIRPEALVGERIGPYLLTEEIGRGGMGSVYRAERVDNEFRIEVAIKIVSRGADTSLLLRRFRTERQILATLDHPYIARLLDGGTTPGGLPYFVMEYVQGEPLTDYCDRRKLNINDRINLFRKVCEAVCYAHHRLIVHRDLKPANILVTADGTPKLLDFGIARIVSGPNRDTTEATVTMMRMATPAYASPEQIRGGIAATPSDIYSLGVILYELLTGHRPYRLPVGDSSQLAQVICEREPTRASAVVSISERIERPDGAHTTVDPDDVSYNRRSSVDQLRRRLSGDLDIIIATALRKEPHRRYESVDQFTEDLQRHLHGMPIHARRDSFGYRAAKFIERHRAGLALTVALAIVLIVSAVIALHKAAVLSHRLDEDQRLASAFLVEIHDTIARLPGSIEAREAILQQTLRYLNGLARDAGDDPAFLNSLAMAYEKFAELEIGVMGPGLSRSSEALTTVRKAQQIRESLVERRPRDLKAQKDLVNTYLLASYVTGRAGSSAERAEYDKKALAIAETLVAADPRNNEHQQLLARAYASYAYSLNNGDNFDDARKYLRQALAIHTEVAARNPSDEQARRNVALLHYRIGTTYAQGGQPRPAQEHLSQALQYQEKLLAANPKNTQIRSAVAGSHHFLGMALGALGRTEQALNHLDAAIAIRLEDLRNEPRDARSRSMLAGNYAERATVLLRAGRKKEALADARQSVELQNQTVMGDPRGTPTRISLADYKSRLGYAQMESGKTEEAIETLRSAVRLWNDLQSEGHLRAPVLRTDAERARATLVTLTARAQRGGGR